MKPIIKTPHPTYESLSSKLIEKEVAKERLGIKTEKVIGFIGLVRKYKGVDNLIKAMNYLSDDTSLLIVGEVWKECKEIIKLSEKKNIILIDKYVEEFGPYLSAMDVVILPYYTSTGSGILQLCWGAGKPVLASKNGSFLDWIEDGKNGLLFDPLSPKDIANKIKLFYENRFEKKFLKEIKLKSTEFGWSKIVDSIVRLNDLKKGSRIVVISEAHRGGVAHYNHLLYNELKKKFNVEHISFSRVYPKTLYKLFFVKTLEDDSFKESKRIIDCLNPLTWGKAAKEIIRYNPDVIVLNWSVYLLAPIYLRLIKSVRKKLKKVKITLLCHNVLPHKKSKLAERLGEKIFSKVDSFIVQSSKDEEDLKKFL